MTFSKHDIIRAQTALLEHFDDDINVDIRDDRAFHITSTQAPGLDFVVRLAAFTDGMLETTLYVLGTSKAPPVLLADRPPANTANSIQLSERIYQWRATQTIAKLKQGDAKSGKTNLVRA